MNEKKLSLYAFLMGHAIGMDNGKTFRKDGIKIYRPYRNYYLLLRPNEDWEALVEAGCAKKKIWEDHIEYSVTPDGLQWLAKYSKICICLTY